MCGYKSLNSNSSFPDGTGFYPDIQDGVRGYNTSETRGADTFFPFKSGIQMIAYGYTVGQNKYVTDYLLCDAASVSISSDGTITFKKDATVGIYMFIAYQYGSNGNLMLLYTNGVQETISTAHAGAPYMALRIVTKEFKKGDTLKVYCHANSSNPNGGCDVCIFLQ